MEQRIFELELKMEHAQRDVEEIKDLLNKLNNRLDFIEQKINYLYENNSPVFAAVLEDEKED